MERLLAQHLYAGLKIGREKITALSPRGEVSIYQPETQNLTDALKLFIV